MIDLKRLVRRPNGESRCRRITQLRMVGQVFNKHMAIRPDQMQLEITTIIILVINGRKSIISMEQIHQQVFHLIYLKITTTIIGNRTRII